MADYIDYDPQKHKGLPLYEIQSEEDGDFHKAVLVKSSIPHDLAAEMPFYFMVKESDALRNKQIIIKGGPGSGHHGHGGLKGVWGGSSSTATSRAKPAPTQTKPKAKITKKPSTSTTPKKQPAKVESPKQELRSDSILPLLPETPEEIDSSIREYQQMGRDIINALPEEKQQAIRDVEAKIKAGTPTDKLFKDENGEWTAERQQLHTDIINTIMGEAQPVEGTPEVIITGGLPGSGKSTVLRQRGEEFSNHVHVDADRIKSMLPEYEGWNAALLHEESSEIAERIMSQAIEGNYNVIYDATLKTESSAREIVNGFESIGYNSKIIFTQVPMKTAMTRAVNRFFGPSQRYVPLSYLATHDLKNLGTLNSLKAVADNWELWDNSRHGQPPTLLGEGSKSG